MFLSSLPQELPERIRTLGSAPLESLPVGGLQGKRYGTIGQVFYIEKDFWPLNTTLYVKATRAAFPALTVTTSTES
jgi:hypothetical protein